MTTAFAPCVAGVERLHAGATAGTTPLAIEYFAMKVRLWQSDAVRGRGILVVTVMMTARGLLEGMTTGGGGELRGGGGEKRRGGGGDETTTLGGGGLVALGGGAFLVGGG